MTDFSRDVKRNIAQSTQVSWLKNIRAGTNIFTIGVSLIGGNDFIPGDGGVVSEWNTYQYVDESEWVTGLEYERKLKLPTGGLTKAIGSVNVDNTSGRYTPYYMGGTGALFTSVYENRRPVIINAGFSDQGVDYLEPQFVGVTNKVPKIDMRSRSAEIYYADFIDFLQNKYVDESAIYTGIRVDTFLSTKLAELGYSTSQYNLDTGMQVIPFLLLEPGAKLADVIDKMVIAENGHLYQDEQGVIRFENRQHWNFAPYTTVQEIIATAMVINSNTPSDDHIINAVEVRSELRQKQPTANIYTLAVPIVLQAGNNDVWISFDNPVLEASAPAITANSAEDGTGSDITSSVSVTYTNQFAQAIKYRINNSTGTTGYITDLTISGREAIISESIYWRERDDSSFTSYDERPLIIDNPYIQSLDWAKSYARSILDNFSDPERLQTITIRAIPTLSMGDLISWQGRDWRVYGIRTQIDPAVGFIQTLDLLQRDAVNYFTIGISTIGSTDRIPA